MVLGHEKPSCLMRLASRIGNMAYGMCERFFLFSSFRAIGVLFFVFTFSRSLSENKSASPITLSFLLPCFSDDTWIPMDRCSILLSLVTGALPLRYICHWFFAHTPPFWFNRVSLDVACGKIRAPGERRPGVSTLLVRYGWNL